MRLVLRSRVPFLLTAALALFALLFAELGFHCNLTPSLPRGLYRLTPSRAVVRGTLVAVCLPEDLARYGRERGYLASGSCPGDAAPLLKRVAALAGDLVEVGAAAVRVNGARLQEAPANRDSRDRPLTPWPPGSHRLLPGEVWLTACHPRSWDSRYFGPVDVQTIRAAVEPVWVVGDDCLETFPRESPPDAVPTFPRETSLPGAHPTFPREGRW